MRTPHNGASFPAVPRIPLFDDGQFVGPRTFSTITALHVRGLVTLGYNRKGYLVRADCVHLARKTEEPDNRPMQLSAVPRAQRYSFRDASIETRPWDLKRLNGARSGVTYAPGCGITGLHRRRSILPEIASSCIRSGTNGTVVVLE